MSAQLPIMLTNEQKAIQEEFRIDELVSMCSSHAPPWWLNIDEAETWILTHCTLDDLISFHNAMDSKSDRMLEWAIGSSGGMAAPFQAVFHFAQNVHGCDVVTLQKILESDLFATTSAMSYALSEMSNVNKGTCLTSIRNQAKNLVKFVSVLSGSDINNAVSCLVKSIDVAIGYKNFQAADVILADLSWLCNTVDYVDVTLARDVLQLCSSDQMSSPQLHRAYIALTTSKGLYELERSKATWEYVHSETIPPAGWNGRILDCELIHEMMIDQVGECSDSRSTSLIRDKVIHFISNCPLVDGPGLQSAALNSGNALLSWEIAETLAIQWRNLSVPMFIEAIEKAGSDSFEKSRLAMRTIGWATWFNSDAIRRLISLALHEDVVKTDEWSLEQGKIIRRVLLNDVMTNLPWYHKYGKSHLLVRNLWNGSPDWIKNHLPGI